MFQDVSPDKRLTLLQENCTKKETMTLPYEFSAEELEEMRKQNTELAISQDALEDEKAEVVSELNGKIKELKIESRELRNNVKAGKIDIKTEVFAFDNQQDGVMEYYNALGDLVYSRPLMPSEKQMRMIAKTGTNNS